MLRAAIFIVLTLVIASGLYFFKNGKFVASEIQNIPILIPAPTPLPFEEITIPYLRNREYKSELGELKKYGGGSNYISYLTSYNSDGLNINGLLTIPDSDGPHPAIVFVHGYIAPLAYQTTAKYVDYVDYLAKNGFVVFKIDLRGHGESEGEPNGAYFSDGYVTDTLNAYSALQSAGFVDPKKVGLWGHSMAGNITFRSFVVKKDIPAIVVWNGAGFTYQDLMDYRIMDRSYRPLPRDSEAQRKRQQIREKYGDFNAESDFWKKVTPINYLDGVAGAIQINYAVDDNVVNPDYSKNLDKVLEESKIDHELIEYPSGGHNMTGASFVSAMQNTVNFFKKQFSM